MAEGRRANQDEIHLEQMILKGITGVANYAIFVLDVSGNIKSWNEGAAKLFGYDHHEAIGNHYSKLFTSDDREKQVPKASLENALRSGNFEILCQLARKDGQQFFASVTVTCLVINNSSIGYSVIVRDVTGRREIEKVLEQSREKYKSLVELASDGIFIADLNGRYTDVNTAGCRMLGYSREEIIGKTIADIILPEERAQLQEARELLMVPGKVHIAEWHLKKKDGTFLPVEISAAILPDGRWQGLVRDISKRKADREILQRSEQKFRGMVENAHDAVLIFDKNGRIEFANKQVKNMFGYEPDELHGKTAEMLMPERFSEKHIPFRFNYIKYPAARSTGQNMELIGKRKDGEEFPVDITLTPFSSDKDAFVTAFIRDSTAPKQFGIQQRFVAETSRILAETIDYEDRVQKIAECVVPFIADWCIVLITDEGHIKTKAVAHYKKEKGSLLVNMQDFFLALQHNLPKAKKTAQLIEFVYEFTEQDMYALAENVRQKDILRELKPVAFIAVPLVARTKVIGMLYLGMSESGRRFNEVDRKFTLLLASRFAMAVDNARLYMDAQNAIRARENVLSIVSHDLKNPITVIRNSCHLINALISSDDREKVRKVLATLERSTVHMERLVADLVDFSKIEAGMLRLQTRSATVSSILDDIAAMLKQRASDKSINLILPAVNIELECDADRIRQVLSNIIGNAIKFTPAGGSVMVQVTEDHADDAVHFAITDTGPGIAKEDIDHVFDRFWQAETSAHLGAGLGLFISKGIVDAHGGSIGLESEVGKGTTFFFSIPRKAKPAHQPTKSS